jgi:hypothetical protein
MSRSLLLIALLSLPLATQVAAQEMRGARNSDWVSATERGCIGGTTCAERRLRIPLQDRPVVAVRFRAHDQIGEKADGSLRVKIDGNTVESSIDIPRRGELFTIEVDELRGRYLVIEPASNDEVEVSDIAVLYGREQRRIPRDPDWDRGGRNDRGAGGWKSYPRAAGCIGGNECGKNGDRITIALDRGPVLGVRFHAHDSIGQRADGKLSVRIDETTIGWYIDVQRNGKRHEIDVDNVTGSKLVIETESEDEVEIKDIEILYGRGGRGRNSRGPRELTHEGGCIGGDECGGRRNRIRIELDGRAVESLRFYARDDVGTRAKGELRIRIDDEILQYALDIPREGRNFTIDGEGHAGDYLYIEATEDDEVVLRDIRVRFADDED